MEMRVKSSDYAAKTAVTPHHHHHSDDKLRLTKDLAVKVLYEDRYFLAIDKPSGYLVAPVTWQHTSRNLVRLLRQGLENGQQWARRRGLKFIANIHRLDADTSGLLLLAKNRPALIQMTARFEQRKVHKTYQVLVHGQPAQDQFTVDLAIAPHPQIAGQMCLDRQAGKPAVTHFQVLARFADYSLLQAEPITGRTHQIRLHLKAMKLAAVADPIYGLYPLPATSPLPRLALHAASLEFRHPFTGQTVTIKAPLATDIEHALARLRRL
jgi:23S rRNA pseudouridine1911/1915/1917 synthase